MYGCKILEDVRKALRFVCPTGKVQYVLFLLNLKIIKKKILNTNYCILFLLFLGFSGHVPFGYASFGKTNQAMTNSALCDFTANYRKRLSTEWAPVTVSRPDPPLLIQPSEIYHRHIGQLPNYGGHIPGAIFRYALIEILIVKAT